MIAPSTVYCSLKTTPSGGHRSSLSGIALQFILDGRDACDRIEFLVGAPRFELGTPSPPDWCANRAALRSEPDRDYNGNRLNSQ